MSPILKIPLRARERSKGDTGVRPFPRIPLASIHLGWAMRAPPGKTLIGMIGQRPPGNWSRHHKTRDWEPHRAALLGSLALLLSPRAPFPIKSLVCQHVCLRRHFTSERQTSAQFGALERGPPSCNRMRFSKPV